MKILQINALLHKGSTGIIAKSIGDYAESKGNTALYATMEPGHNSFEYQIGTELDHKIHALYARLFGKQGYCSKRATRRLINWIDRISPDVIIMHNLHSNYINLKILFNYIKEKSVDTVLVMHDCWLFTGKCYHYLYSGCSKWKNGCGNCTQLKLEQKSFCFDKTHEVLQDRKKLIGQNTSVKIVAVSEWLGKQISESVLSERPLKVIRNGIDLEIFKPCSEARKTLGIGEDKFVIMGMANKWLAEDSKECFQRIIESLTDNDMLIIAGCNKAKCNQSTDKIKYIEKMNPEKLPCYYSAADVFVNLTKADSLPTVNMEAIACGTPVITYNSGGSGELIEHGETGYVVPYGDIGALSKSIHNVKEKGKKFYTEKCRSFAMKNFDKNANFSKYIDFIGH